MSHGGHFVLHKFMAQAKGFKNFNITWGFLCCLSLDSTFAVNVTTREKGIAGRALVPSKFHGEWGGFDWDQMF